MGEIYPSTARGRTVLKRTWLALCVLVTLGWSSSASAQVTWEVPGDSDTIQGAIDLAATGDTIEVAEGTYEENIDYLGKGVTIVATGDVASTVIDGTNVVDNGSIVSFVSGEGTDAVLDGFTITGGVGTGAFSVGGGIYCDASTPQILNCVITANTASEAGGAYFGDADGLDTIVVEGCTFDSNCAGGSFGGVQFDDVTAELTDCVVRLNVAEFAGGGVVVRSATVTVEGCTIESNECGFIGGGLDAFGTHVTIVNNTTIANNLAGSGGGIAVDGGELTMSHCAIVSNEANNDGGGIIGSSNAISLIADSCTIANNSGEEGGGFFVAPTFDLESTFTNSIFYDNSGGDITANDFVTVTYSLVGDGFDGEGNIDGDPDFRNVALGDFRLRLGSPAIDAGDPLAPLEADGTALDQGAFPYDQTAQSFLRGDCDGNGQVFAILDALFLLEFGFIEGTEPPCLAAADTDGNGIVFAILDSLYLLVWAFQGGPEPPDPGPTECGTDPSGVECFEPPACL